MVRAGMARGVAPATFGAPILGRDSVTTPIWPIYGDVGGSVRTYGPYMGGYELIYGGYDPDGSFMAHFGPYASKEFEELTPKLKSVSGPCTVNIFSCTG